MISISTTEKDELGNIVIMNSSNSKLKSNAARITKTATLDGDVFINHFGVVEGDRNFSISATLSKADSDKIWRIFNNYKYVNIAIDEGVFYGSIKSANIDNGNAKIEILIKSKETI